MNGTRKPSEIDSRNEEERHQACSFVGKTQRFSHLPIQGLFKPPPFSALYLYPPKHTPAEMMMMDIKVSQCALQSHAQRTWFKMTARKGTRKGHCRVGWSIGLLACKHTVSSVYEVGKSNIQQELFYGVTGPRVQLGYLNRGSKKAFSERLM